MLSSVFGTANRPKINSLKAVDRPNINKKLGVEFGKSCGSYIDLWHFCPPYTEPRFSESGGPVSGTQRARFRGSASRCLGVREPFQGVRNFCAADAYWGGVTHTFGLITNQKNPRAHKNKIGPPPPPPPNPKYPPPLKRVILWTRVFPCRKSAFFQASIKLTHPFPAPELRKIFTDTRIFLITKHVGSGFGGRQLYKVIWNPGRSKKIKIPLEQRSLHTQLLLLGN